MVDFRQWAVLIYKFQDGVRVPDILELQLLFFWKLAMVTLTLIFNPNIVRFAPRQSLHFYGSAGGIGYAQLKVQFLNALHNMHELLLILFVLDHLLELLVVKHQVVPGS